ncbi:MAG: hypothetical protein UU40_C0002G0056 [Candidatus Uhrbacteria bacterium GW2011_GWD2_41_121]|uniref:Uncharacterized protein n=1 Tax=Candidatus Uhrbacteria bacterium GW2011_GWC1_41_20 TaxID=1618983 RepID=A0A0G0VFX8_9BACT|nr:MAG: hypothetical protein UT52_C0002G0056 [Candidatus Uhrbacteria bacterium GW2011_GWE1_39_46]KKR64539.1 MAG: hypothetical protein UU04_C0001G0056 [Candidatus Uhrbacteria bacterium GW2011_GWC2_40_450]KKR90096.1 MAG: hypothetical protein UU36_C0011G0003 [Candidatus Uhrbacteria bacterium GW2011_GWE2_41_1153]KKR90611.1 MAG: hypothetical protein UU40_C0002G0056 [Candidatus Uhrbacteria bacterium GW2011_GWD2_41_121]KKR96522.1 MAG: hypothetical protein UU46_C0002G0058 [Candidatus Uhrbacteria bacter
MGLIVVHPSTGPKNGNLNDVRHDLLDHSLDSLGCDARIPVDGDDRGQTMPEDLHMADDYQPAGNDGCRRNRRRHQVVSYVLIFSSRHSRGGIARYN